MQPNKQNKNASRLVHFTLSLKKKKKKTLKIIISNTKYEKIKK